MVIARSSPASRLWLGLLHRAGHTVRKTGRSSAQVLRCSCPAFPDQNPIHGTVTKRHSKHDQCARYHRRTGCGNVEVTAPSADDETQHKTNGNLHDSLPSENKCLRAAAQVAAMPQATASGSEIE